MSEEALRLIHEEKKNRTGRLDLGNTGLMEIPKEVFELDNLISIDLSKNQLNRFEINHNMKGLKSLCIQKNPITDHRFLKKLSSLEYLNLGSNKIRDLSILQHLQKLRYLDLNQSYAKEIDSLKSLKKLEYLSLKETNLRSYKFLESLTKLKTLNISNNQISTINFLKPLINLQYLFLGNNNIQELNILNNLDKLQLLDISLNYIKDLTEIIPLLRKTSMGVNIGTSSSGLLIHGNPIQTPPPEIYSQGKGVILEWFDELEKHGEDYLYEAKMLVIGTGGAGKTSLINKLKNRNNQLPKEEETTKGIDIHVKQFLINNKRLFTLNIWDFGGQEIYHATHQFFLTKRSLYVLVDDTRGDDKSVNDSSFRYWLQTAGLFGVGSPLLIFQNEKGGRSKDLDMSSMRVSFDFLEGRFSDDLLKQGAGLNQFEQAVEYHVQNLPHVGDKIPKQWLKIRQELFELAKNHAYITKEHYFQICLQNNISEKQIMLRLSSYLHDLGTFLHFQDDDKLHSMIILQNDWATEAVYKVLDDEMIKKNKGVFNKKEVQNIWNHPTYEDKHHELLSLMKKFELAYELDIKKQSYLIPQLLPESKPEKFFWNHNNNLQVRYIYKFMPKGLLSRFIVRTNHLSRNIDSTWKNGVVLEKDNSKGLVEELYAMNEIVIRTQGKQASPLMNIIIDSIDKLNKEYEGIKVEKLIPCICNHCIKSISPHFFNYDKVLERHEKGKESIECDKPPYLKIEIIELVNIYLKEYIKKARMEKEHETVLNSYFADNIYIQGDHIQGGGTINKKEDSSQASSSESTDIKQLPWWGQRILLASGGGILSTIIAAWFRLGHPFSWFLIAFTVLSFILLKMGNPERRFYRAGWLALTGAIGTMALDLGFTFNWVQNLPEGNFKLILEKVTEYGWVFGFSLVIIAGFLFYLDMKKDLASN